MDIAAAKQQIKNTVQIYLQKNALGQYCLPLTRQRPVFLLGAPGLGKTAIMQQIANELNLGFVSYSMTHHTRQSALGLPVIVEKEFDGWHYQVSEYTMSEIIASIYDEMRKTGKREGILFLDEINCVSETLSPSMLLFLQYKIFGGHPIPEGWVVVTAGNPPRFNKNVREFDAATRDRLKVIEVEPSYSAWKPYALQQNISQCILGYLDIRPADFYKVETTVDGMTVVTPRAWQDLSEILQAHERLHLPVNEDLISQYLQNKALARDFSVYYELYQKYRQLYQIDAILQGDWGERTLVQARSAKTDERMSLVSLLLEAVFLDMHRCTLRHDALAVAVSSLKQLRSELDQPGDLLSALANWETHLRDTAASLPSSQQTAISDLLGLCVDWRSHLQGTTPYDALKRCCQQETASLKSDVSSTQSRIGCLLRFLKQAFGKGIELSIAVNDLTVSKQAAAFLGQFLSTDYFEASQDFLLHRQSEQLLHQIDLTGLV